MGFTRIQFYQHMFRKKELNNPVLFVIIFNSFVLNLYIFFFHFFVIIPLIIIFLFLLFILFLFLHLKICIFSLRHYSILNKRKLNTLCIILSIWPGILVYLLVIWVTLVLAVRLETPLDTNVLTVATWQLYRAPGVSLVTIQPSVLVSRTDSVTTAETCVNVSCKWQLISSELNTPVPVIGFFQESWKAVSFKVFTLKSETAGGSIQYCKLFCLKIPSFLCAYFCLFNFVHMLLFSIINFQNTLTFFHLKIKTIWECSSFIPKPFYLTLNVTPV